MGSFSAALNALATSATNDWYMPRVRGRSEHHYVQVARVFTVVFAVLQVGVATWFAYAKISDPSTRIIPTVLGIASYILGPMLGVFLIGMFTKDRGSDRGNMIAVTCGLLATAWLGGWPITAWNWLAPHAGLGPLAEPSFKVSFTWFAMVGALVVFAVGALFRTPPQVLETARATAEEASTGDDRPMELRADEIQSESRPPIPQ
jgi:hypothetical protein